MDRMKKILAIFFGVLVVLAVYAFGRFFRRFAHELKYPIVGLPGPKKYGNRKSAA
jgi:hypothetical protein